jgi:hypothetical protein
MPNEGNTPSGTPRPSNASTSSSDATNEEQPTLEEVKERNLSDGFLQVATELHELAEAPTEPTPTLFARILSCIARVLGAFFRR